MVEIKSFEELKSAAKAEAVAAATVAPVVREPQKDKFGRSYATGRRKDATAKVWIKPGSGKITVNGRDIEQYFTRPVLRMIINQPFAVTNRVGQFDVTVSVSGGAAKVRITWDPNELDIDPFFAAGKRVNTTADDWSEIIVPMDSGDATGSYLIQFYNHTGKTQWTAWTNLPIHVELVDEAEGASSP